jgi:hypothetical protein
VESARDASVGPVVKDVEEDDEEEDDEEEDDEEEDDDDDDGLLDDVGLLTARLILSCLAIKRCRCSNVDTGFEESCPPFFNRSNFSCFLFFIDSTFFTNARISG